MKGRYILCALVQALFISTMMFAAKQEHPYKATSPEEAAVGAFIVSLFISWLVWMAWDVAPLWPAPKKE